MCIRAQPERQASQLSLKRTEPTTGKVIGTTTRVLSYAVPVPGWIAPSAGAAVARDRAESSEEISRRVKRRDTLYASSPPSPTVHPIG